MIGAGSILDEIEPVPFFILSDPVKISDLLGSEFRMKNMQLRSSVAIFLYAYFFA